MPTNQAVLNHLTMVCNRQILWSRRPPLFNSLLGCEMIEIRRVPPIGHNRAPELFDIAVLTGLGRQELDRLQRFALGADWQSVAWKPYEAGGCVADPLRGGGELHVQPQE